MSYVTGPEAAQEVGSMLDMFIPKKKKAAKEKAKAKSKAYVDKLTDIAVRMENAKAGGPGENIAATASSSSSPSDSEPSPTWLKWAVMAATSWAAWKLWSKYK